MQHARSMACMPTQRQRRRRRTPASLAQTPTPGRARTRALRRLGKVAHASVCMPLDTPRAAARRQPGTRSAAARGARRYTARASSGGGAPPSHARCGGAVRQRKVGNADTAQALHCGAAWHARRPPASRPRQAGCRRTRTARARSKKRHRHRPRQRVATSVPRQARRLLRGHARRQRRRQRKAQLAMRRIGLRVMPLLLSAAAWLMSLNG